jgi:pSer/pThr/pTyr-binding forkhead associated (FHA) protein
VSERDEPQPWQGGADTTMSFPAVSVPDAGTTHDRGGDSDAPRLTTDQQRSVDALPAHTALLVVQRGPNAGARFLLDADRTTAGRQPSSDIFLDDVTVSRKHAEFVRDGDSFRVRDVGSLNGTYVNRDRVDDVPLAAGDEVQIGKYRLTFHPHRPQR